MQTIFWGAGKQCLRAIGICKSIKKKIDYIVDKNVEKWGNKINQIEVCSPEILMNMTTDIEVFIVCGEYKEIENNLLEMGVKREQIKGLAELVKECITKKDDSVIEVEEYKSDNSPLCLIDLENGITLGGIEQWAIGVGKEIERKNITVKYLIPKEKADGESNEKLLYQSGNDDYCNTLHKIESLILANNVKYIISNFCNTNFYGTCLAKNKTNKFKHIVICHNDVEKIYNDICTMEKYIDVCFVISQKMKGELLKKGFPKQKIKYMRWYITGVPDKLCREYSKNGERIVLGYAGRIVVKQKRCDLFINMMKLLVEKGVDFELKVAGDGEFKEELMTQIIEKNFEKNFSYVGRLSSEEIRLFWKEIDVMVSCSEWEGHSISQCEAMAEGVIPILTDVSGVRDDVIDGKNGYIYQCGNIDDLVQNIEKLYKHRGLLCVMGGNAHSTILENNKKEKAYKFNEWEVI